MTAARYVGARVGRVEDARLLTGHSTFVDDIVLPGMLHAYFVRSQYARAAIRGIDTCGRARGAGRSVRVHRGRPQSRREGAVAHVDRRREPGDSPTAARRRPRCASSATPSRSWSPTSCALAMDAAELVDIEYEPLPAGRRLHHGRKRRRARTRAARLQRHRRARPACRRRRSTTCSRPPRTSRARRSPSTRTAPAPMECRGVDRRLHAFDRRADDALIDPGAARGAAVLLTPARHPRAPDPRRGA